ncbi:hypothetical protein [Paenibacillus sp. Soil787]|uniref:hypothetical protein n=1 Tax=Paenibacillus sp. Soil787 TaxID=1736411 RepID=UPI0007036CFC|nr:hypothetical protein [Paenibacillus sp. Soil787]KRF18427.1 hypothetical protein ASG93_10220 [Paenibacillus sp. Soil787]
MAKRKLIAVSFASMLVAGTLAGCVTSSTSTKGSEATPTAAVQKKYDIKVFTTRIQPNPDSDVMKKVQEKLGQNLIVTAAPDAEYNNKMNLLYASNDLPDVFNVNGNDEILKNATAKFTEDEFKKYMPDIYAVALKQYQDYGVSKEAAFNRFSVNGKLAGVMMGQTSTSHPYGLVLRKDMVDSFGLKTPQTLNDWEAILKAYKEKYPTKYPITARGKDAFQQSFYLVLAANGVTYNNWQLKDNKLVYAPFMPEMREALATLNKWYKAGYINPEWITMDNNTVNNEWINGNTIYYQFLGLNIKIQDLPEGDASMNGRQLVKNPQAKLDYVPFPKAKDNIKPALITYEGIVNQALAFGKQLEKDPDKLHAVMKAVNALKTDPELYKLLSTGIEGKTYDMVDGVPSVKKEFNNADAQTKEGFNWGIPGGTNWDIQKSLSAKFYIDNLKKYVEDASGLYSKENNEWAFNKVNGPLISPSGENLDTKGTAKLEEYKRMFAEVVIGTKSLEDFDKFIEQYKKEVGIDMTEAANRLYLKQWLK